jgi:hypothetical protein
MEICIRPVKLILGERIGLLLLWVKVEEIDDCGISI